MDDYDSCFNLAMMYKKGDGVKKDIDKSKGLFEKACNGEKSVKFCYQYFKLRLFEKFGF